jgi:hypothetical protein
MRKHCLSPCTNVQQSMNPILKILFILSKNTFRAFRLPAVLSAVGVA